MALRPNLAFGVIATLIVISFRCCPTNSSTHWVVTDEGKIQAQVNSIFHMKRPYDLVSFLEQEKRVEQLENLKQLLAETANLDKVVEDHKVDLESNFYDLDSDCQKAGQPLTEFDLFVSTLIHPDPTVIPQVAEILRDDFVNLDRYSIPYCEQVKPEKFRLDVIDDLSATMRKDILTIPPEMGLTANVLQKNRFSIPQYGHLIQDSIEEQPMHNWLATLLASHYWRILGRAKEAVECLRKSINSAPVSYKHLPLLSLANIFHRSQNSHDAIETLELALKYDPDNPAIYFTLGNVYATLLNFNSSVKSYGEALKLQPQFEAARSRRYAVLCHHKLEQALEEQHRSLEKTLNELRQYKKQHDEWSVLLNKILAEQATLETRMESRMSYEDFKMRQSKTGKGQNCFQHTKSGKTFVTCSLLQDNDVHKDLLEAPEEKDINTENIETWLRRFGGFDSTIEAEIELPHNEPSMEPKYHVYPVDKPDAPYNDPEWPSAIECTNHGTKLPAEYPTVFLSPENKGFSVAKLMSESIKYPLDQAAPLPWLPPKCPQFEGKTRFDKLASIEKIAQVSGKNPERVIGPPYYIHSAEKNYHEWGARVNMALNQNVGPKWVVYVLAGTFWRIFGSPQEGLQCYKWALSTVPKQYEDVVLTNLAGLFYKSGSLDDAYKLLKEAHAIDNKDPDTNFFLGNILSIRGNLSGAIQHYKSTLKMVSEYHQALDFLKYPACESKFKQSTDTCISVNGDCKDKEAQKMILCKDGDCKHVSAEEWLTETFPHPGPYNFEEPEKLIEQVNKNNKLLAKKSRKKRKKKQEKKKEVIRPKEGEDTVLLDHEQLKHATLPMGAVEIGTIAENDQDDEDFDAIDDDSEDNEDLELLVLDNDNDKPVEGFVGPIELLDDAIPDIMIKVREKLSTPQPTESECQSAKEVNWEAFTSTWLSVSAKNIDIREYLGDYLEPLKDDSKLKPYCPEVPTSLLSMDHLTGVRMRQYLHTVPESGLREAFQGLVGEKRSLDEMATRIALEMDKNSTSWVLSTAAALYWRVKGQTTEAVQCLRHSLYYAPRSMKDIPLVSLANILHRAGLYNDALIATNMALEISPKFVVTHFTMANIYVSKNELELAVSFYLTTLALQSTFEPARDRLVSITCGHRDIMKNLEMNSNNENEELKLK